MEQYDKTHTDSIPEHITALCAAIQYAIDKLTMSNETLTTEIAEANTARKNALYNHVTDLVPDLTKTTRDSLLQGDVAAFMTESVRKIFDGAVSKRPAVGHFAIAFLYETSGYETYSNYVALHRPNLQRQMAEYLESEISGLDRLEDVRDIDVQLLSLKTRLNNVTALTGAAYSRLSALAALNDVCSAAPFDQAHILHALHEERKTLRTAKQLDENGDLGLNTIGWMASLPNSLVEWGIDPVRVS